MDDSGKPFINDVIGYLEVSCRDKRFRETEWVDAVLCHRKGGLKAKGKRVSLYFWPRNSLLNLPSASILVDSRYSKIGFWVLCTRPFHHFFIMLEVLKVGGP